MKPESRFVRQLKIIADYAFIVSNVLVMTGARVGRGAVVHPGLMAAKNVDDYAVVGGNLARFIRYRSKDLRYSLSYNYWFAS